MHESTQIRRGLGRERMILSYSKKQGLAEQFAAYDIRVLYGQARHSNVKIA
jgi:hypothetical protein